jgi:hypothetical protein
VSSCTVTPDGDAEVHLRLPTYFCAPNFAFLMVADAYDAVSVLEGVHSTRIVLDDHFASDAINDGVAARAGFEASFAGEAAGELDELRADFLRKAVMAGTDQVCRTVSGDPSRLTLGEVPRSPALTALRRRRVELGLPAGDDAPLLVDPRSGGAVTDVRRHLALARLHQVGIEANTSICSGMLHHRYKES